MGTCPVYSVTLRQDGTASWHGEIFTDPLGDAVAYIDGPDFHALAGFVERSGFFSWASNYSGNITCVPGYSLTVVGDGQSKSVHQMGTHDPPNFWVIARLIDAIAHDIGWGARVDDYEL